MNSDRDREPPRVLSESLRKALDQEPTSLVVEYLAKALGCDQPGHFQLIFWLADGDLGHSEIGHRRITKLELNAIKTVASMEPTA